MGSSFRNRFKHLCDILLRWESVSVWITWHRLRPRSVHITSSTESSFRGTSKGIIYGHHRVAIRCHVFLGELIHKRNIKKGVIASSSKCIQLFEALDAKNRRSKKTLAQIIYFALFSTGNRFSHLCETGTEMRVAHRRRLISSLINEKHAVAAHPLGSGWGSLVPAPHRLMTLNSLCGSAADRRGTANVWATMSGPGNNKIKFQYAGTGNPSEFAPAVCFWLFAHFAINYSLSTYKRGEEKRRSTTGSRIFTFRVLSQILGKQMKFCGKRQYLTNKFNASGI